MTSMLPSIVNDPDINLSEDEIEMEIEDREEPSPEPILRENLSKEEVFEKPKKKKRNVLIDPIPQQGPEIEPISTGKKQRKQRKPMTQEQKDKLAEARKKGLETRKRNAEERRRMKELEGKAVKKMKQNKQKELERIVDDRPEEPPKPIKAEIDETIIQKAIDDAIVKHETLRQQRKAAKKAAIAEEVQKRKVEEQIKAAMYPPKAYFGDSGFASKHIFNFR